MDHAQVPVIFAGVDWASQKHDVCIVDPGGTVLGERAFPADAGGLAAMADWLVECGRAPPGRVGVAIEVPHGPIVETLLERGFLVHAINPKQLDRFRDRFTVAGAKDDRRDARVLADSLRTDRRAYRALRNDEPEVIELREWSRMTESLSSEENALCNEGRVQLLRYFPQVLELGELTEQWIVALVTAVPTPASARKLQRRNVESILRTHRVSRLSVDEVLAVLRKPAVSVAPGTVEAATAHLRLLLPRLRLVREQLRECREKLDEILARMGQDEAEVEGRKNEPRDVDILLSLPGVGRIVAATLLAEASRPLRDRDYPALRTHGGIAPVTKKSGKSRVVGMRLSCNGRLRNALYHAARVAAQRDPAWKARYYALRAKGHSHGRACRGVADSLLRVAFAMLRTRTLYDPSKVQTRSAA